MPGGGRAERAGAVGAGCSVIREGRTGAVSAAPTAAATAPTDRNVRSVWKAAHRARMSCQSGGRVVADQPLILLSMGTSTDSVTTRTATIKSRPASASQAAVVDR